MKGIDDMHRLFRLYSVWVFMAIVLLSVGEALMALYVPPDLTHALLSGLATGVLGVAGILLRAVKQEPRRGQQVE